MDIKTISDENLQSTIIELTGDYGEIKEIAELCVELMQAYDQTIKQYIQEYSLRKQHELHKLP